MSIDETEQVDERGGLFEHQLVAAPGDDTMQWRAALLQMVNWGGFAGLTTVPLGGDATMISGASGVGKSTILDAYTALMMPSDTKFNGASNDAVSGRARGVGQRNLLSYLRGAVDVVDDPRTGRPVEKLLRGRGVDTWGAVAMT
ncbi:ATP-binding protein, partial [Nocardioides salarius]